jgi:hypothetical protein
MIIPKSDELVKSQKVKFPVIPANPGSGPGQAPESSYFKYLKILWTPVSTGVTTFYEIIKSGQRFFGKELSETETRVASERVRYDIVANYYDSRVSMFPGIIFGFVMGFNQVPRFESEKSAKKVPDVG